MKFTSTLLSAAENRRRQFSANWADFSLQSPCGAGAQVVADLVLKVAQRKHCAEGVSNGETWLLRDLEDKVCYYLPPVTAPYGFQRFYTVFWVFLKLLPEGFDKFVLFVERPCMRQPFDKFGSFVEKEKMKLR